MLDCCGGGLRMCEPRWPFSTKLFSSWNRPTVLASAWRLWPGSPLYGGVLICPLTTLCNYLSDRGLTVAFLPIRGITCPICRGRADDYLEEFRRAAVPRGKRPFLFYGKEEMNPGGKREASQEGKNIYLHESSHRWPWQAVTLEKIYFKYLWHKWGHGRTQQEVVCTDLVHALSEAWRCWKGPWIQKQKI